MVIAVQCLCGRGSYDPDKFSRCFRCNTDGKVKCPSCGKGYVDPLRFVTCFKCNEQRNWPPCGKCGSYDEENIIFRSSDGLSLMGDECFEEFGVVFTTLQTQIPMGFRAGPQIGSSYIVDDTPRDPGQVFAPPPPPTGFPVPVKPAWAIEIPTDDTEWKGPPAAPAPFVTPGQEPEKCMVWMPWMKEWVPASSQAMPDHHITCYTRHGQFPIDWEQRGYDSIKLPDESLDDFVQGFIATLTLVEPNKFQPTECTCLEKEHTLCPIDGNPIFNGSDWCLTCGEVNNLPF